MHFGCALQRPSARASVACMRVVWRVCGQWCAVMGETSWVIEFYAPWCTHCRKLTQPFKEAAENLDGEVEFGALNCARHKQMCNKRFGIRAYPTLLMIHARHGVEEKFPSGKAKTADAVTKWARRTLQDWLWLFGQCGWVCGWVARQP